MKKKNQFDNSSLALRRYKRARSSLLLMMLFTVINTVQAAMGSLSYFVFSDYLAYYCALFGRAFYEESGLTLYIVVGCAFAALILVPYLLGWLIAALVMFIIDTVLVIVDAIGFMEISYLLDIAFHIWLIVELILGIRVGKEAIAEMNAPAEAVEDTAFFDASIDEKPNTPCLGEPQSERKYRLIVQAQHGGRTIEVRRSYGLTELVIDGRLYGVWEGLSESAYEIVARVDGHEIATRFLPTGKQTIEVDGEMIAKKQRLF